MQNLLIKLGARSRLEAVALAIEHGAAAHWQPQRPGNTMASRSSIMPHELLREPMIIATTLKADCVLTTTVDGNCSAVMSSANRDQRFVRHVVQRSF
jgi:hypothetical protein